jgi:hypothetical protein
MKQTSFAMGLKIRAIQFLSKVVIFAEYREHQGNRIPETAEQIQYRILIIKDLWETLGLLFDMPTEL